MSVAQNKAVVRRFVEEVWSKGNIAAADQIVAPDAVDHDPMPKQAPGVAGFKQVVSAYRAAFPDVTFTAEDLIAEGDKVAVRWSGCGTQEGEYAGIAPTGRQVCMTGIDVFRLAKGKIVERWANQDDLGVLKQLGAFPLTREAGA